MSSTIPWRRYIATGDSLTEGLWDTDPADANVQHGWADRLAGSLARRRYAAGQEPLEYANLAVRGLLLETICTEQVPRALELEPDLISIVGGGNDMLRPSVDPDRLAAVLERAVIAAQSAGAQVLLATGADTRGATVLSALRPKTGVFNAHIWSIARRRGAHVLDLWGLPAAHDRRLWADDRIHLNAEGHRRAAEAGLVGLGLEPDDPDYLRPLPPDASSALQRARDDARWLRRDVYPWARRHLRGHSSREGRTAKRPEPAPMPITGRGS